jgi:hypothetical protein
VVVAAIVKSENHIVRAVEWKILYFWSQGLLSCDYLPFHGPDSTSASFVTLPAFVAGCPVIDM